jgi:glycosyltransferase involved in cell wall biosynthesis
MAGGAEKFTHEVARRLVASGSSVEWFSASFPGALPEEEIDGIRVIRAGRQWTVHLRAFGRYRSSLRRHFDVVIDEVNTIPFFTPLWAKVPRFMLIHQLAREVWWYETRFPVSALGYVAEPLYLRLYRRTPVLTVSASTEQDLRRLGFSGQITVVPEGIESIPGPTEPKNIVATFLFVGRLAPSKRVIDLIHAFATVHSEIHDAQLWLVGQGQPEYVHTLEALVRKLGIQDQVRFWGRLPEDEKHRLMARAHILLMTSAREGWGLAVTEANACGTPAVAYNVAGLRDAVIHERTGLLVEPSPALLAKAMLRMWRDKPLYSRLAEEATSWSKIFTFEKTADVIRESIVTRLSLPELVGS